MNDSELICELKKYGLRRNEAKVYVFLSKTRIASAPEISNKSKVARTEAYLILKRLENKQLVFPQLNKKPILFTTLPIEKALDQLMDIELIRIQKLNEKKNKLIQLWKASE